MKTILVTGHLEASLALPMLLGFHEVAVTRNWILHRWQADKNYAVMLRDWRPDAMVCLLRDVPYMTAIAHGLPLVRVGYGSDCKGDAISLNDRHIGQAAADHLVARGFERVAMFGYWNCPWALERAGGFAEVLRRTGHRTAFSFTSEWEFPNLVTGDHHFPQAEINRWIRELPKPVGLFAGCDSWGRHLIDICRLQGIRVPEDIAVLGADNDAVNCELSNPPLSSVVIPWTRMGREGAQLVARRLEGERGGIRILVQPTGIISRRSTDTQAVNDADVAAALAFIGSRGEKKVTVRDILRAVPVSQHLLERKFKALTGRRLLQEIRRVHVERAKRLLATTDLPMPQVASHAGFANASKLAIAFKKETNTTPSAYRRKFGLR